MRRTLVDLEQMGKAISWVAVAAFIVAVVVIGVAAIVLLF